MNNSFTGKVAIVTGGARGIGFAIVKEFAEQGSDVVILDKYYPDNFEQMKSKIKTGNNKIEFKTVDISNTGETLKAVEEIHSSHGKIDFLINNAGITRDKLLMRMNEEDWDAVMSVNLKGTFNTIKAVAKIMAGQRYGKIVNIGSVVGIMGNAGQANYSASKAGIIGLTKSTAKELAGRNINVNCVAPGYVETEMTLQLSEEQRKAFLNIIPLKRASKPEDIAGVVAFLCSDKADYITGQVICVDGGMIM